MSEIRRFKHIGVLHMDLFDSCSNLQLDWNSENEFRSLIMTSDLFSKPVLMISDPPPPRPRGSHNTQTDD